ncbi:fizzy-related protein homolog [Monodelphis domestica]|uniref:Fizzy-related protein homolog n=1 Tax=Monodelphis domestica TaxID=13616 RepID=F6PS88_MONDO|nr:fizzy-related protein homolog [Monodelphis domestica]XP_056665788.1 fizzy-related protein homolog [Monodelphis domestica]XP_056665789.1 fizzy-related protein homolog [Monodelphis domestica]
MSWSLALPPTAPVPSASKYGDRYIPSRVAANWEVHFHSKDESELSSGPKQKTEDSNSGKNRSSLVYSTALKNELLGARIQKAPSLESEENQSPQPCGPTKRNLFTYSPNTFRWRPEIGSEMSAYAMSPISKSSQTLLTTVQREARIIPKSPFRILEAPELSDDFYLNLLDWSRHNIVAVGLGSTVFLWSATTSQVTELCDLAQEDDAVTSVSWTERGTLLAVGTQKGVVQIWDADAEKRVATMEGHSGRVSSLAWNGSQISSGSRDRRINQRDIRAYPLQSQRWLQGHKQEVCGLKWSTDHRLLASGGNDNRLLLWNCYSLKPVQKYTAHKAAVKAIAWSPHQHRLLASGGGSADRCIRFWNTLTGQPLQHVDTGSQVCNLAWSKQDNELVSTHGYSENQIVIWKYPSMTQVAKLTGHLYRVLYLAVSPDGQTIVTGAGDKSLRFWNVFRKACAQKESASVLSLFTRIR